MKRICSVLLIASFIFSSVAVYPAHAAEHDSPEKIVFVTDISGSMSNYDSGYGMKDALSLAVGLAPDGAQAAFISVNSGIVADTDIMDTSSAAGRSALRKEIDALTYGGNTNLALGLERAVEKLEGGPGRIILLADISDNALTAAGADGISQWTRRANELAESCSSSGIVVDLVFLAKDLNEQGLVTAIEDIAAKTGGHVLRPESGDELPGCVEEIYFSSYTYLKWPITGVNTGDDSQSIPITMPTEHVHRGRIYIPSAGKVQAAYAGAKLEAENRPTFSLLDLSHPAKEGVTLTAESEEDSVEIILITDYRLKLSATAFSEIQEPERRDEEARQHTVVTLDILDQMSGKSILDAEHVRNFTPKVTLTEPGGAEQILNAEITADNKYRISLFPEIYGTYSVTAVLSKGEYTFPVVHASFDIEDISVSPDYSWVWKLIAAVAIGLVVLTFLIWLIWKLRRRRSRTSPIIPALENDFSFSGRLDFYVTAQRSQDDAEIPPFTCHLTAVAKSEQVTLQGMLDYCGVRYPFGGAENIHFTPGPDRTLYVKNAGFAGLLLRRSVLPRGKNSRMAFGEKLYFTATDGVSEIAIYYRNVKSTDRVYHSGVVSNHS